MARIAAPATALLAALLLASCAPATPEPSASDAASPSPSDEPVTFAVLGDSLSAGSTGRLSNGIDDGTWISSALTTGRVEFVGGWAQGGATLPVIASHASEVPGADVLVLMGGTNDIMYAVDRAETSAAIESIAAQTPGVLVAAIAPITGRSDEVDALNRTLSELAADQGWSFTDPWTQYRGDDAAWSRLAPDGVHPAIEVHATIGPILEEAIASVDE